MDAPFIAAMRAEFALLNFLSLTSSCACFSVLSSLLLALALALALAGAILSLFYSFCFLQLKDQSYRLLHASFPFLQNEESFFCVLPHLVSYG